MNAMGKDENLSMWLQNHWRQIRILKVANGWRRFSASRTFRRILDLCDKKTKSPKWQNLDKKYEKYQHRWKVSWNSSGREIHRNFYYVYCNGTSLGSEQGGNSGLLDLKLFKLLWSTLSYFTGTLSYFEILWTTFVIWFTFLLQVRYFPLGSEGTWTVLGWNVFCNKM